MSVGELRPRVGISVLVEREGKVLLGLRQGAHGASSWAPPGGHLEFGESVEACARRELFEETGMRALQCRLGPWVENVMEDDAKHYITLFVYVDAFEGEPQLLEPEKCVNWEWTSWDTLPKPLFSPLQSLIQLRMR
jgi:8-oxo-dGTP diphosphatase